MSLIEPMYAIAVRDGVPLRVTIELTTACNLACAHCYVSRAKNDRLTLPRLVSLFDELQQAGGLFITLTGGEIGLRRDLFEIIAEARQRRFAVTLLSNGTLWGPADWDRIAASGTNTVRVSLYAPSGPVHDAVTRTAGSFDRSLATLRGLIASGVRVELAYVVTNLNSSEAGAMVELADELGVGLGIDPTITWTDRSERAPEAARAAPEQLRALFGDPRLRDRVRALQRRDREPDSRPCFAGDVATFIRSSGDVLPCVNWPEAAGDLLETAFLQIFRDSPVFRACRQIKNRDLLACHGCRLAPHCRPCPGMNLQETGSVGRPSPATCAVALTCGSVIDQETGSAHSQVEDSAGSDRPAVAVTGRADIVFVTRE